MSAQLEHRRFNVTEYHQMAAAGILTSDERVELIEGEIIKMGSIGSPHAACVSRLSALLHEKFARKTIVSTQNPVRLDQFSEPVPDIALLKPRTDFYAARHPLPADVLLIIEVADTSLLKDRNIKVPLYARTGIKEVWLVNLSKRVIEVYSDLHEAEYRACKKFKSSETFSSPGIKGLSVLVDDILGE